MKQTFIVKYKIWNTPRNLNEGTLAVDHWVVLFSFMWYAAGKSSIVFISLKLNIKLYVPFEMLKSSPKVIETGDDRARGKAHEKGACAFMKVT